MNLPTTAPRYAVGDVVVVPFPGSAGAAPKNRPAVVLATVPYGAVLDYIVCLITSQAAPDPNRLMLLPADIQGGTLTMQSYLRPAYLYTVSERLVTGPIGTLVPNRLEEALEIVIGLLRPTEHKQI